MSCVLRITGKDFDCDAFVSKVNIPGFEKSYKGDARTAVNPQKKRERSSASITTSEADFDDVKTQIEDTVDFLNKHQDNLKHILTTPQIEFAVIDFGVDSTINENRPIQSFYFAPPLIKICSELGIGIELSIYK